MFEQSKNSANLAVINVDLSLAVVEDRVAGQAIDDQVAVEVGAEDLFGNTVATGTAAGANGVDGDLLTAEAPQPGVDGSDALAGLVGVNDGGVTEGVNSAGHRSERQFGTTLFGAGEGGRADGDSAVSREEVIDLTIGNAEAVFEFGCHGEDDRPERVAGGADGVGDLLGMAAALVLPTAVGARSIVPDSKDKGEPTLDVAAVPGRSVTIPALPATNSGDKFLWNEGRAPAKNYSALGRRLAIFPGLYRDPNGGLICLPDSPHARPIRITKGAQLAAIIIDRIEILYVKDDEERGGLIPARHLTLMLATEAFLGQFRPFDEVDRSSEDLDPLRQALGLLGAAKPDVWMPAREWAKQVAELGLVGRLIPAADRENERSRERGIGVVLSAHTDESFRGTNDKEHLTLHLEKARRRFEAGNEATTRYRFVILQRESIPEDAPRDKDEERRADAVQTNGQARKPNAAK